MKGGRIGKVTALAGSLLNIKPILTFAADGQLESIAKVRGKKALTDKLIDIVAGFIGEHQHYSLIIANGGRPEDMEELRVRMEKKFPLYENFWETEIDATLSTYIGDGVLGAGVLILD
jgi:DegV family protein with EDD domain